MNIRTKKYSMSEFKSLPRYEDGSIKDLYDHFLLLTKKQVELISEDDSSRYEDYQEEMRYLMADVMAEFGV